MDSPKRCFVVMGFGIKTDFATGRKLDLNKSYRLLIKPVVEEKGLSCVRADEIPHSGSIDVRMYQELLKADVVIADISTANVNAFYELGIRHALRPRSTIVISEDKLTYPFDLNHVKITSYTHLGDAIDYEEVERFRRKLGETIDAVLNEEQPDSPVYTYLRELMPPKLQEQTDKAVAQIKDALDQASESKIAIATDEPENEAESETLAILAEQGEQALKNKQYLKAKSFFNSALHIRQMDVDDTIISNDAYLIQRLALATYKAQEPDVDQSLLEAIRILDQLDLDHTNDPETVALAGAIEKRLYENEHGEDHLHKAILYYERGFHLLNNRHNGINLAFMINCRAGSSFNQTKEEIIADLVYANRLRKIVLKMCENDWFEIHNREDRVAKRAIMQQDNEFMLSEKANENEQKFWILANKAEAYYGLGYLEDYRKAAAEAESLEHAAWMMESFNQQIKKLGIMLKEHGYLLNPAWPVQA